MIAMNSGRRVALAVAVPVVLAVCLAFAASAGAAVAWWHLDANAVPANLPPGGNGTIVLSATDLGDAAVNGSKVPVKLVDKLPADLTATSVVGKAGIFVMFGVPGGVECEIPSAHVVECTFEGTFEGALRSYERLEIEIAVSVGAGSSAANEVSVSGGESYSCSEVASGTGKYTNSVCDAEGAGNFELQFSGNAVAAVSATQRLAESSPPVEFGVEKYELTASNEDGSADRQAGSHPFSLTTTLDLNRSAVAPYQPALPKDLQFRLPPGLIGNPNAFPQCSAAAFHHQWDLTLANECPAKTALGVAVVTLRFPENPEEGVVTVPFPVFNLKPAVGEPARFGFDALGVPVILDTSVRTGEGYGVTVSSENISQTTPVYGAQVTLWGVPGDPSHDQARGSSCLAGGFLLGGHPGPEGPCATLGEATPPPFLALPTSCAGPMQTSVLADSWAQAGSFTAPLEAVSEPILNGCSRLPFSPSISVAPDGQAASSPTGLTVDVHVPQELTLNPNGLAEADVKNTTVTLPEGVTLDAAAADGLEACSEAQIALESHTVPTCPEASKVGTVEITTPLLPNALTGAAYLATQDQNPFGSLVAMYIVAQDPVSGTLVKVAGEVTPNPVTGQLVTTFDNTPQLPFEDLRLHFFGGSRAPLATPAKCGDYTTTASFAPWSGNAEVPASSEFDITSGPNGGPCPGASLPFAPSLAGGTTNVAAGNFTPFTMTMSREDGEQQLQGIQLHMPPGLLGMLSSVTPCEEAQASVGACSEASKIGETTVSVGVGGTPYTVTGGRVYITGPYHGAPYGLAIEEPAKAGPFDLENTKLHNPPCDCLVVRARIEVNPVTAALIVTANSAGEEDAIPTMLEGIPLQIKHVNVTINRGGFTFNPTDCDPLSITGSLSSAEGSAASLSVPFQVTNCAALAFKPTFAASTPAHNSRTEGAGLTTTVTYPGAPQGSDANIAKVKVSLPAKLPARLTTLQKACPEQTFAANPANCPAASRIGQATTNTPVLPNPLSGPAYFVSHGGAKYPELVIVLQGDNVTIDLHGETAISKKGILTSTFNTVPDAPFSRFELSLPEGPYSALTANGANLCKSGSLTMPTELTAQDGGAPIKQNTKVTITGCPKKKVVKHKAKKGKRKKSRKTKKK
jgi:hypothetical protein